MYYKRNAKTTKDVMKAYRRIRISKTLCRKNLIFVFEVRPSRIHGEGMTKSRIAINIKVELFLTSIRMYTIYKRMLYYIKDCMSYK